MAIIIEMPKLSDTMREGKILSWHKQEGEAVQAGEVLAEIESDKANMEMEAYDSGFLRKRLVEEGGSAPVGAPIAIVTEEAGEDIKKALEEVAAKRRGDATAGAKEHAPEGKPAPGEAVKAAPRPAAAGKAKAATPQEGARTASREEPRARPAAPATRSAIAEPRTDGRGKVIASPLAFRMAAELGIDLKEVRGSGPEGRIVKRDIEETARRGPARSGGGAGTQAPAPARAAPLLKDFSPTVAELPEQGFEDLPVSSMRKVIATRLAESKFSAPHYYVTVEVDMRPSDRVREELNQLAQLEITYNDLVVKAAAVALTRHPALNGSWQGDHIRRYSSVDIGIAVALPDGLITPVVRACHVKTLGRISMEIKDLAERAKAKKLAPEEFQGSTFTVSNMGMFGVKHFTAIINPPEAAILAVGSVLDVPVVDNGAVVPGRRMALTLSSDHRAVDGAQAALFLREVKILLERPMALAL